MVVVRVGAGSRYGCGARMSRTAVVAVLALGHGEYHENHPQHQGAEGENRPNDRTDDRPPLGFFGRGLRLGMQTLIPQPADPGGVHDRDNSERKAAKDCRQDRPNEVVVWRWGRPTSLFSLRARLLTRVSRLLSLVTGLLSQIFSWLTLPIRLLTLPIRVARAWGITHRTAFPRVEQALLPRREVGEVRQNIQHLAGAPVCVAEAYTATSSTDAAAQAAL